nr:sporulation integral membrane protein YtvI [Caldalkalibacillus mannanilyticus]
MYYILPLIYPFLIGIIFALMLNPLVDILERRAKFPRWLSVTLAIILLLAILVTIVVLVVIEIANEITNLQVMLPVYIEDYVTRIQEFILDDILSFYDQFTAFYSSLEPDVQKNIETQVTTFTEQVVSLGKNAVKEIFNGLLAFIGAIPSMATAFIISLLASFFISKDWPKLRKRFLQFAPDRIHTSGGAVLRDLRKALFGFVKAQFTLISITFTIVLIGFIVLRVEYGLTLAIIIAFVDLLPISGRA